MKTFSNFNEGINQDELIDAITFDLLFNARQCKPFRQDVSRKQAERVAHFLEVGQNSVGHNLPVLLHMKSNNREDVFVLQDTLVKGKESKIIIAYDILKGASRGSNVAVQPL